MDYREEDWKEENRGDLERKETMIEALVGGVVVIGAVVAMKIFGLKLQSPVAKKK